MSRESHFWSWIVTIISALISPITRQHQSGCPLARCRKINGFSHSRRIFKAQVRSATRCYQNTLLPNALTKFANQMNHLDSPTAPTVSLIWLRGNPG